MVGGGGVMLGDGSVGCVSLLLLLLLWFKLVVVVAFMLVHVVMLM